MERRVGNDEIFLSAPEVCESGSFKADPHGKHRGCNRSRHPMLNQALVTRRSVVLLAMVLLSPQNARAMFTAQREAES